MNYTVLGEFDLLCHSRAQVQDQCWLQPAVHEATTKYFKFCWAQEEIDRLNVKIHRLHTTIHDEDMHTMKVIQELNTTDPLLGLELQQLYCSRAAINAVHLQRLDNLAKLSRYTGPKDIGVRLQPMYATS